MDEKDTAGGVHHEDTVHHAGTYHDEKTPDDKSTHDAQQLATDVETEAYSPWTGQMIRLYLVLIVAYLCGCLNGYDGSLMGGLNGMSSYQQYFHM